ncbi:hypothetical protein ColKHC_11427 [Colletotrichum higginsianum]|nr:hypothetical protein ColKHC_11427 [Colletotrichum higginsianum]
MSKFAALGYWNITFPTSLHWSPVIDIDDGGLCTKVAHTGLDLEVEDSLSNKRSLSWTQHGSFNPP